MKVVKCIFKCNAPTYSALISELVRRNMSHSAEFTAEFGKFFVTVICPTFHAEQTVAEVSGLLQCHPLKYPQDADVSPQQLQAHQQPVQDQGLIKP